MALVLLFDLWFVAVYIVALLQITISSFKNALGVRTNFVFKILLRWQAFLIYNTLMKNLILFFLLSSSACFAQVAASNVFLNVSAYTGLVVTVSGTVKATKKDGLSNCSFLVDLDGLFVRVWFDARERTYSKGRSVFVSFETATRPAVGEICSYSGTVKKEMGKPFLITEKRN